MIEINKKSNVIKIERNSDASKIIDFSAKNGLPDIEAWTNVDKIQKNLNSNEWIGFVAKDLKRIIGVIIGALEVEGRIWIENIAVSKMYRNQGIGKALIEKICEHGKNIEFRSCFVDVDDDNFNGIAFYENSGFKKVGSINNYYYDNSTALIYMKFI